jgi:hypothetical protein
MNVLLQSCELGHPVFWKVPATVWNEYNYEFQSKSEARRVMFSEILVTV